MFAIVFITMQLKNLLKFLFLGHSDNHIKNNQFLDYSKEITSIVDNIQAKFQNGASTIKETMKSELKNANTDQSIVKNLHPILTNGKTEMDCTKLAFEQFLKSRKEATNKNDKMISKVVHKNDNLLSKTVPKNENLLNKTVHNLIKFKKEIFCQTNENNTNTVKSPSQAT